jgi:hypothetical protein
MSGILDEKQSTPRKRAREFRFPLQQFGLCRPECIDVLQMSKG